MKEGKEMVFDDVMMEITRGLTGDREHDIPYLQEKCRQYRGHVSAREILRACGRLVCFVNAGHFSRAA